MKVIYNKPTADLPKIIYIMWSHLEEAGKQMQGEQLPARVQDKDGQPPSLESNLHIKLHVINKLTNG